MSEQVTFLYGKSIRTSIEKMMRSSPALDIAVAYWSEGGLPELTLSQREKKTRIICDLMSGLCEVAFIRKLRVNDNIHVKRMRNLHAKVYLGVSSAVIGSANASSAGLNATSQSKREAAVLIAEGTALTRAHDWFELMWARAKNIDEADLIKAEAVEIEQASVQAESRLATEQPASADDDFFNRLADDDFFNRLADDAFYAVMKFARDTPGAVQVRFGNTGVGAEPNFMLIFNDKSMRSFEFPKQNGEASEYASDWRSTNLTAPIPVWQGS